MFSCEPFNDKYSNTWKYGIATNPASLLALREREERLITEFCLFALFHIFAVLRAFSSREDFNDN